MRGEEAPPPRGGRHPPLAVWAPVILTVRVVWHSFQVARRVGSGRGPLGLWSASGGFVGVVVGRAQYVQAECYRGVRSRHTAVWRGAVHLRVRMYVGHDVLGTSITSYTLSRVTQSTARTVEVSELPAAARVVAAVGVVI